MDISELDLPQLEGSPYGRCLAKAMQELDCSLLYKGGFLHNEDHIFRTMVLGACIARGENYSLEDAELLLLCCSYHDIGRHNDDVDPWHGPVAAERIRAGEVAAFAPIAPDRVNAAAAAIAAHSRSTALVEQYGDEFGVEDRALMWRMVRGLKDADNLDRVRLEDLDVSHLRTDTAKGLEGLAWKLLRMIPPAYPHTW